MLPQNPADIRAIADLTIGRSQGPELWDTLTHTFATPGTLRPNRFLDCEIPISELLIVVSGRLVIGTADYSAVAIEAMRTLVERIIVRGRHERLGAQVLVDMSGATIFAWPRLFQSRGNLGFSGTTTTALDADLSIPAAADMAVSQATIDFELHYWIPFYPMVGGGRSSIMHQAPYYLRRKDWGDSLQLEIQMGDRTSLGTPAGGTTTTWTAYASASGTPTVEVYPIHSALGDFDDVPGRGYVVRVEDTVSPALVAVSGDMSLYQLRQAITTNIVVKSGVALTGTSAGVNVFASLSDRQLDRTQVIVNNKRIRNTGYNRATKAHQCLSWNTVQPEGYLVHSFVDGKSPQLALRADKAGGIRELRTQVLTASANNRQTVTQEQIIGGPFPA